MATPKRKRLTEAEAQARKKRMRKAGITVVPATPGSGVMVFLRKKP